MIRHLFVCGTLRSSIVPADLKPALARARLIGLGTVQGRLYDLGPYPGAVLDPLADSTVKGEVLEIPDDPGLLEKLLEKLDDYEGIIPGDPASSLFLRKPCQVRTVDREIEAWIYVYNGSTKSAPIIESGDYLAR